MGLIASWILELILLVKLKLKLLLTEQLLEKRFEDVVRHDAGVWIGLPFAMKNGGGRLANAVGLTERKILVNHGIEGAALDERANLVHFRGGENCGDSAVHVAGLFPFFLVLEEGLFDGLNLAELCRGASVARGNARMRVHGKREIAMDQVDLARADVVVHQPAIGGGKECLASRALKIAEDFHCYGGVLRAEGFVGIDVGKGRG